MESARLATPSSFPECVPAATIQSFLSPVLVEPFGPVTQFLSHTGVTRMSIGKRAAAEFFGTFWLVFGGCGSAVLAAAFPTWALGF